MRLLLAMLLVFWLGAVVGRKITLWQEKPDDGDEKSQEGND